MPVCASFAKSMPRWQRCLRSLQLMVERGPKKDADRFFAVLRAMLFYVDEFPERLHHPKETELLFPKVAMASHHAAEAVEA